MDLTCTNNQHLSTQCSMDTCTRKLPAARAPKTPSLNTGAFCRTLVAPTRVEILLSACPLLTNLGDDPGAPLMLQSEKHLRFARPRKCINGEAWMFGYCKISTQNQISSRMSVNLLFKTLQQNLDSIFSVLYFLAWPVSAVSTVVCLGSAAPLLQLLDTRQRSNFPRPVRFRNLVPFCH